MPYAVFYPYSRRSLPHQEEELLKTFVVQSSLSTPSPSKKNKGKGKDVPDDDDEIQEPDDVDCCPFLKSTYQDLPVLRYVTFHINVCYIMTDCSPISLYY